MELLQFRSYIFPHNPHTITVRQPEEIVTHFCPGRGEITRNMGPRSRTVHCQGSFFGATFQEALAQLKAFRAATEDGARGILMAPGLSPFPAWLSEFTFEASGNGRMIPYTMVFTESREVGG